jgi:hypothetical protein
MPGVPGLGMTMVLTAVMIMAVLVRSALCTAAA